MQRSHLFAKRNSINVTKSYLNCNITLFFCNKCFIVYYIKGKIALPQAIEGWPVMAVVQGIGRQRPH
jgi:hypothetical protein